MYGSSETEAYKKAAAFTGFLSSSEGASPLEDAQADGSTFMMDLEMGLCFVLSNMGCH